MTAKKTLLQKPKVPEWLITRQLNSGLVAHAILPAGVTADDLVDFLNEENSYEGPYSHELMTMICSVEHADLALREQDPVFHREYFGPWYSNTLAPVIHSDKFPDPAESEPPPGTHSNGNIFLLGMLIIAGIAVTYMVISMACPKALVHLFR